MKRLTIVMCVIVALCGCGKKETVQKTAFLGDDYKLEFPGTWEINDKGIMGTDLIGLSPIEDAKDTFRENVNVVLENLPKSMTDAEYLQLSLKHLNKVFALPPDKKFTQTKVGNQQGYHLRYSMQMGQNNMDNDVYVVIKDGAAYIITCSHAKGKRDAFKSTIDSIVDTFAIE